VIKPTAAGLLKINTKRGAATPIVPKELTSDLGAAALSDIKQNASNLGSADLLEINWIALEIGAAAHSENAFNIRSAYL
jgi:hypothetical protein